MVEVDTPPLCAWSPALEHGMEAHMDSWGAGRDSSVAVIKPDLTSS